MPVDPTYSTIDDLSLQGMCMFRTNLSNTDAQGLYFGQILFDLVIWLKYFVFTPFSNSEMIPGIV